MSEESLTNNKQEGPAYEVMTPDARLLKGLQDIFFACYAYDLLERYNLKSPYYPLPMKRGDVGEDAEKPPTIMVVGSLTEKPGEELVLRYFSAQENYVWSAVRALNAYRDTGTIPQNLRDACILEDTKQCLEKAPYAATEDYRAFCAQVLDHVREQCRQHDQGNWGYGGFWQPKETSISLTFSTASSKPEDSAGSATPAPAPGRKGPLSPG